MTSEVTTMQPVNATLPYVRPFDETSIIASASILFPLMVMGIIGNLLTIITISVSSKLKSVFYHFILSLCVSDLLSALISPLFLYRRTWGYDDWNIPDFFCKLYWAMDIWTSYVTAIHILLFAILRLISVRWPHQYGRIKPVHGQICIICTWLLGFAVGFVPFVLWFNAGKKRRNTDDVDARWPACTLDKNWGKEYGTYTLITYSFFFYSPVIAIVALTTAIAVLLSLRRREREAKLRAQPTPTSETKLKKSGRKEKEAMLQLGLIAASFMLGYVPFTVYEISSAHIASKNAADERFWWKFGMAEYICLRISETLNPVFYNLASGKMRNETFRAINKIRSTICCCQCEEKESNVRTISSSASTSRFTDIAAIS